MRLGFGVRLMPKPYNHPVRTAESVAVLDLISNGRVDLGTGRSSTRAELEGFGIDPGRHPRACGRRPSATSSGCWTNDEYEFEGEHWSMPPRRVQPKPIQQPHPPIWGATSSDDGHRQVGELGLGLCSFAVGVPPEAVKEKIDIYRTAIAGLHRADRQVRPRPGVHLHHGACARPPSRRRGRRHARASSGTRRPARGSSRRWPTCRPTAARTSAPTRYAADLKAVADDGSLDFLDLEYLETSGACVLGTPDQCIETCRRYEAAGVDQLLCLVNPYKIPHETVMQTIQLMGEHVIPEFR